MTNPARSESEPLIDQLSLRVAHATRHLVVAIDADEWECTHCEQTFTRPVEGEGFVSAGKLKTEACRRSGESRTVVNIAFMSLIEDGTIEEDPGYGLTFRRSR